MQKGWKIVSVELYISEIEVLNELFRRVKIEAKENGCELDSRIFRDTDYAEFLMAARKKHLLPTLLETLDTYAEFAELQTGYSFPVDMYFADIGTLFNETTRAPKSAMHFWTVYALPHLCGAREFQEVFSNGLDAVMSELSDNPYEARQQYRTICTLFFPSAEEIVERTLKAVKASENDKTVAMDWEQVEKFTHLLARYEGQVGSADEWLTFILGLLRNTNVFLKAYMFHWFALHGLPYIFGFPQMTAQAYAVTSRLPIRSN